MSIIMEAYIGGFCITILTGSLSSGAQAFSHIVSQSTRVRKYVTRGVLGKTEPRQAESLNLERK